MSSSVQTYTKQDLRDIAAKGAAELEGASALELLQWTEDTFGAGASAATGYHTGASAATGDRAGASAATGDRAGASAATGDRADYIVASNMQDAVLVHLAAQVRPGVDVLFLDTGYHFAETIGTRDAVEAVYGVNIVNVAPEQTVDQQDRLVGKNLFTTDPGECCRLRKVVPLQNTLRNYSAWVTGIRRVEAPTRANAPLISFDEGFGLVKINPIAAWSDDEMNAYIAEHGILVNPLVEEGYPSIGCAPCTRKPEPGSDPRSGRWAGFAKTECGLHAS